MRMIRGLEDKPYEVEGTWYVQPGVEKAERMIVLFKYPKGCQMGKDKFVLNCL